MGRLQVLPSQIANMIAAGEVVQRPASVVKELMENAIDAGADKVSVILTDSGRTLIQVIDNGCGMSAADAVLCFERHATSKIAAAEDLESILTFGFRGEALASIAAVSEVTLKTRREQDDTATEVRTGGGSDMRTSEVSGPVGSSFAIRNLFFNTPARRKFLKADSVELKHCIEEFTRVALTRPSIEFTLSHNGKDLYRLRKASSMKFRILDIMGGSVTDSLVDIDVDTTTVSIHGFVGKPEEARKTQSNQYFFINGRYFRSAYFNKAVLKAYEGLIPDGTAPSYFLFLEARPDAVDVNIHPTKTEIKFEDDSIIFQTIYASVKETVGRNSFGADIDFDTAGAIQMPQVGSSFSEYRDSIDAPAPDFDPDYNPFSQETSGSSAGYGYQHTGARRSQDYSALFDGMDLHAGQPQPQPQPEPAQPAPGTAPASQARALVIKDKFIVTSCASGMMIVNIRRANERILFEKYVDALSRNGHVSQKALFPVTVRVGVQQQLLFQENAGMLSALGFDISMAGTDSIVVGGVPEGFSCESGKVEQLMSDLQFILSDNMSAVPEVLYDATAGKFATLGAMNAAAPDSPAEAQKLIDSLFACQNPELTPRGQKIVAILSTDELEKRF